MRIALALLLGFGLFFSGLSTLTAAPVPADPTDEQLEKRARALNQETRTIEDADARLKELIKDKPGTTKLVKVALKLQKQAKDEKKPFRFYAMLVLAKAAQNVKDFDAAEVFYQACSDEAIDNLQSSDLTMRAVESQLDFFWTRKKYDAIEKLYDRVMTIEGDDTLERFKMSYLLEQGLLAITRKGEMDRALTPVNRLLKSSNNYWYFLQVKARIYREAEKYDDALKTYDAVIESLENEKQLKDEDRERLIRQMKYVTTGILTETKQNDKAIKILKALVKEDPKSATYKNDLGFVLADNDLEIDLAAQLVKDAVELDLAARKEAFDEGKIDSEASKKANAAYIDSLGWVLFKQKKYDEALKYLLESAESDESGESRSIEIWDHVGDCYLAMGKKKEAMEMYAKALKMEDVSKRDADRRRKVTEKLNKLKSDTK